MKPLVVDTHLFDRLAAHDGTVLISMFIPTHTKRRGGTAQDPIRLKNQLAELDGALEATGRNTRQRSDRLPAPSDTS